MEKLHSLEQIAKFAKNDRIPFECECVCCSKHFIMQVRSLKNKKDIICHECETKRNNPGLGKRTALKRQETYLKKYGCKEFFQTEEFKQKSKQTCIKKYGCEKITQSREFIEHALETRHERYGDVSFNAKYFYNDVWFDSSWELAYYIWLTDAKIEFEFHPKSIGKYIGDDGKEHLYFPDFLVLGEYQEIKGNQFFNKDDEPFDLYSKTYWWRKFNWLKSNNVKIIRQSDLKPIFEYIEKTYGKNYLRQFNLGKYVRKK